MTDEMKIEKINAKYQKEFISIGAGICSCQIQISQLKKQIEDLMNKRQHFECEKHNELLAIK